MPEATSSHATNDLLPAGHVGMIHFSTLPQAKETEVEKCWTTSQTWQVAAATMAEWFVAA